ncbi:MAG: hypothetical protein IAE67_06270 [Candidatus Competibacteraceae bacterium]|nr:hypothetical protein [Candidatus Competibacteraceae bacterium]
MSNTPSPQTPLLRFYFLYLSIFTLVLLFLFFFFQKSLPLSAMFIVPVFYVITSISHIFLKKSLSGNGKGFLQLFLLGMTVKMMAYLIFLAVMMIGMKETSTLFVIVFFFCYVLYTTFEILMLRPLMKKNH